MGPGQIGFRCVKCGVCTRDQTQFLQHRASSEHRQIKEAWTDHAYTRIIVESLASTTTDPDGQSLTHDTLGREYETRVARDGGRYTREEFVSHYSRGYREWTWYTDMMWSEARMTSSHYSWITCASMKIHPQLHKISHIPLDEWDPVRGHHTEETGFRCLTCACTVRSQEQLLQHRQSTNHQVSSAKWTMTQAPSEQRPQQPESAPEAAQPQEQYDNWRHRSPVRPVIQMDTKQVWTDGVCHRTDARRRTRSLGDILDSDFDSDLYSEAVVRTNRPKSENDRDFPSIKSDYRRQRTPHTPQTLDHYRMRIHRMVARYPKLRP